MKRVLDECVGCCDLGLQCQGITCPNRSVTRFYCDNCDEEITEVFLYDGQELCEDCLKNTCRMEL
jgi:hypothetical protein